MKNKTLILVCALLFQGVSRDVWAGWEELVPGLWIDGPEVAQHARAIPEQPWAWRGSLRIARDVAGAGELEVPFAGVRVGTTLPEEDEPHGMENWAYFPTNEGFLAHLHGLLERGLPTPSMRVAPPVFAAAEGRSWGSMIPLGEEPHGRARGLSMGIGSGGATRSFGEPQCTFSETTEPSTADLEAWSDGGSPTSPKGGTGAT